MGQPSYFRFWGKACKKGEPGEPYHLLPYHCLDVAAVGRVLLQRHPALRRSLANLTGRSDEEADPLVVYDELGAGVGSLIGFSEGAEATQPFRPERKPVDAYNAALLDTIDIET